MERLRVCIIFQNERQFTKSDIISLHHRKANFTMELCTKYCHGFLEVYLGPIKRKNSETIPRLVEKKKNLKHLTCSISHNF